MSQILQQQQKTIFKSQINKRHIQSRRDWVYSLQDKVPHTVYPCINVWFLRIQDEGPFMFERS